ncbi:hypothetical protein M758_2G030400 [Ceratodon purpureus]|nr:hypothetical protein M758_2G030400 [Ceratodon purpureus]
MDEEGHTSVVLHADLDCFYAAVEQVRLGIPTEQPLAVQQWEGLIAVNYAARAAGIVRHERVSEALRKCPDLHLVHVETIGGDKPGTAESLGPRGNAKASLERYRQASAKVFNIFRRYSKLCERASIDEAYLDVSEPVEEMLEKDIDWEGELLRLLEPASGSERTSKGVPVMLIEGGSLAVYNAYDRRLLAGAIIADQMRAAVRNELGYTISVGIASNKLLAKIASAKNKPDRQTLIPPRSVPGLMKDLPLKKIKLLGGKLGEEMKKKWGCTTAGEAQQIPQAALVACFGDRLGTYAWKAVQGLKAEKVQVKDLVKSMLASKSFGATNDPSDIRKWVLVLAQELAIRMRRDFEMNQRQPKLFQLYYRTRKFKTSADHSRSVGMPPSALQILSSPAYSDTDGDVNIEIEHRSGVELSTEDGGVDVEVQGDLSELRGDSTAEDALDGGVEGGITERTKALAKVLEDTSLRLLESVDGLFPCTRLAIAATGFQELPNQGTKSIQHFFTSKTGCTSPPEHSESTSPRQNVNNFLVPVSPSKKSAGKPKGILKYLGSSTVFPTDAPNDKLAAADRRDANVSSSAASPSKKLAEKPKGILKYLDSNTCLTTCTNDQQELVTFDKSPSLPTNEASELYIDMVDDDTRPCDPSEGLDGGIDLETVNIDEQRHILEGIYRSRQIQSVGASLQSTKRGPQRRPRVGSSKRAREQAVASQPRQPNIGNYFQARNKP